MLEKSSQFLSSEHRRPKLTIRGIDHTTSWKVETSISEAKIVRIGVESLKIFPSRPEKWANGLSFFAFHTMPCRVLKFSTAQCVTQHRTLKAVTSHSIRVHKSNIKIFDRFLES